MNDNNNTSSSKLLIENTRGLHARASAKFVKCAETFSSQITVACGNQSVPGTSIMGLMMLGACKGTIIGVTATGPDHKQAIEALSILLANKFDED